MADERHPKTRQAIAQLTGNVGGRRVVAGARNAAAEGVKRVAAHERAAREIAAARSEAIAQHNQMVRWQNNRLDVIRTRGNQRVQRIVGRADQAMRNASDNALRAARNQTAHMERSAQEAIGRARAAQQRAYDAKIAASRNGIFANSRAPGVPQSPALNPVRAAEIAENNARTATGRAYTNLRRLRTQAPIREAAAARTAADKTARAIEANANRVVRSTRAAEQNVIRATKRVTDKISADFAAGAVKVMEQAGPKATFIQRALGRVSQLGQPIAETAGKTVQAARTGGGLFASRAEIATRLAAEGRTGKVLKTAGKIGEKVATAPFKAAARVAKAPVKAISGALNLVEKGGKIVAGTGRAGKIVTGLTNATGLAGGFAAGAWIDAGLNYAQFKAEGHSFSDLGKTIDTFKVTGKDGKEHTVEIKNPTLGDVVFSRKYAGEAIRGTLRNLTFGVFGDKEYDWENGGPTPGEQSANLMQGLDPNTGKPLTATDGTDVSGIIADRNIKINDVVKRNAAVASYFASFDPKKQVKAGDAQLGARLLGMAGNARSDAMGFISAVKHLGELKDQKIEGIRQRLAAGDPAFDNELGRIMRTGVDREKATSILMDQAMKHETSVYEKRLGAMMKSDAAAKASDYNRRAAYLTITGRDYDVDTSATLDAEAKQNYADFNEIWSSMDAKDRVLFDREGFHKGHAERISAAENAAEANAVVEEVANG